MAGLGQKAATGATWMMAFKVIDHGIGVVSILILARLLVPADFGLVAIATAIVGFIALLAQFSFDTALIQDQQAGRDSYDTAWTITLAFGAFIALILLGVAGPLATFYEDPRIEAVMYFLALGSVVEGCNNVGVVEFRKNLQFHKEFVYMASRRMAGFVVTLILAFLWRDYWALVAGILATKAVALVMSFAMHPYRPRLSLAAGHKLFRFSKWLMINNVITTVREKLADFIITKVAGTAGLGIYTMSYEIPNLVTTEMVSPINRALYPTYSKLSENLPRLGEAVTRVTSVLALVILPAGLGVAAVAEPLVHVALGSKWIDCIPLVRILAFYGLVGAVASNFYYVFLALGKPQRITTLAIANLAILIPSMLYLTLKFGPLGAAWALLLTRLCTMPMSVVLGVVDAKLQVSRLVSGLWRPAVAGTAMFFLVRAFLAEQVTDVSPLPQMIELIVAVALGVVSYVGLLALLWLIAGRPRAAEHELLELGLNALGRGRRQGEAVA